MAVQVDHYGLHFLSGGIGVLVEETSTQHALDVPMQFDIVVKKPHRHLICPHAIDLNQGTTTKRLADPLAEVMMPLPKEVPEPTYLLDTEANRNVVHQLMRLSSPNGSALLNPLWMYTEEVFARLLKLTNVQPLVIYGFQPKLMKQLTMVIEASWYMPRRLIVMLPSLYLNAKTGGVVETGLNPTDLKALPLEKMGAQRLRQTMLSKGHRRV